MKPKKTLLKIDHSLITYPKKRMLIKDQITLMYWNLWGQFGFNKDTPNLHTYNVSDYAWTTEAKKEFYAIPFHAKLLKSFEKKNLTTSWLLDCEPADFET